MVDVDSSRAETRTRIVDVAARLLQEQGAAAVTTRGVAEGAGVQAPTIYRLFGDKDGLLDAVAEHVLATYVSSKAAVVAAASAQNADPLDDLRAGWDAQIDFGVANPSVFGLLSDPGRGRRSPAAQSGLRVLESRVHRVAETGRLRVSEDRAVAMIHAAGTGTVLAILSTPLEDRDPTLAPSMYDAVVGQILTTAPDTPERTDAPVATAVALRALTPRLDALTPAEQELLTEWLDRVITAPPVAPAG